MMRLREVAVELSQRLTRLFLPGSNGQRPCAGENLHLNEDALWQSFVNFHEYFHGETGRGLGASHQTGWTALVVRCLEHVAQQRAQSRAGSRISAAGLAFEASGSA